jgi:hypothetical protein
VTKGGSVGARKRNNIGYERIVIEAEAGDTEKGGKQTTNND